MRNGGPRKNLRESDKRLLKSREHGVHHPHLVDKVARFECFAFAVFLVRSCTARGRN